MSFDVRSRLLALSRGKEVKRRRGQVQAVVIKHLMRVCSVSDQDPDRSAKMMLVAYGAIDRATTGHFTKDTYNALLEVHAFAIMLARVLHRCGSEDTKKVLLSTEESFNKTADAMAAVRKRAGTHGKYVLRAEELLSLRETTALLEQMLAISTEGHVARAVEETRSVLALAGASGGTYVEF